MVAPHMSLIPPLSLSNNAVETVPPQYCLTKSANLRIAVSTVSRGTGGKDSMTKKAFFVSWVNFVLSASFQFQRLQIAPFSSL
jgi:hypothetical protein